jgi:hypothetical protein
MFRTTFFKVSWEIFSMAALLFFFKSSIVDDDLSTQLASYNPKESNVGVLGLEAMVVTNFWILSCHQRTA